MNAVQQDKCFARRIARAGCVDALGIVRVRHAAESTRVASNAERVLAWRYRANEPGRGNPIFSRKWNITVPRPLNASLSRDSATIPPPEVAAGRAGASLPSGTGCDREHEHSAGRQSSTTMNCGES